MSTRHCYKIALIAGLFFAVTFQMAHAATESFRFPSFTAAPVGSIIRIPVSGTVVQTGIVTVSLQYTPTMMRILGVYGNDAYGFRCGRFNVTKDSTEGKSGFYSVECGNVISTTNNVLFEVEVLLLNGTDSTGAIVVSNLVVDGDTTTDVEFTPGTVLAEGGSTVLPSPFEGIQEVFPNPVVSTVGVTYVMLYPGPVDFDLITTQGRRLLDLGTIQSSAGSNTTTFSAESWMIPQGVYILRMVTEGGTFLYSMVVLK